MIARLLISFTIFQLILSLPLWAQNEKKDAPKPKNGNQEKSVVTKDTLQKLFNLLKEIKAGSKDPKEVIKKIAQEILEIEKDIQAEIKNEKTQRDKIEALKKELEASQKKRDSLAKRLRSIRVLQGLLKRELPKEESLTHLEPARPEIQGSKNFSTHSQKISEEKFRQVIGPTLALSCVRCHNPEKQKGKLDLTQRTTTLKGGTQGPALIPGDYQKSILFLQTAHLEMPHMPPGRNKKLPQTTLESIKLWIQTGASWGEIPNQKAAEKALEEEAKKPKLKIQAF